MRTTPLIALAWLCILGAAPWAPAQVPVSQNEAASAPALDSDHDGLSDELEQTLLAQFAPAFMVGQHDCSNVPAMFAANLMEPVAEAQNGTIYGQVLPAKLDSAAKPAIEIHYYHLWKRDCGRLGHELDAEHVSVLVLAGGNNQTSTQWKAAYWYAAAHEDTVCDASQISRASTLHAEDHGPRVWISSGKHASFLNEQLCGRGCGGDHCEQMVPLSVHAIVNLGERGSSMNGTLWSSSQRWPLQAKMARSDFQPAPVARLENLPATDIAWANPPKRPVQATIAVSDTTFGALATSNRKTDTAISTAGDATGNALDTTYKNVKHALGRSVQGVGNFLRGHPRSKPVH